MTKAENPPTTVRRTRWVLQTGLALALLAVGIGTAALLMDSAPKAGRRAAERPAHLVETTRAETGNHRTRITAMGSVVAARETTLYPEVTGRIVSVGEHFLPGGRVHQGEVILHLDDADYRLAVRQAESAVAKARAALEQERGQQAVAQRESKMLGGKLTPQERALVLRKPQLASAEAALADAKATLDQAKLNLERTAVKAPFDGIITERSVALGSRVTPSTALLSLVATGTFWVRLDLPLESLRWIDVPQTAGEHGSTVRLRQNNWPKGVYRTGQVLRLVPKLESDARLAQLLVAVPDPLAQRPEHQGLPQLLVNDYVEATVEGKTLTNVFALDRALLHNGDRVWLFNKGQLEVRPVEVAFRGPEKVLIQNGLSAGDRVVTTDLTAPVPGMALRTVDAPTKGRKP
jgi:RND family efflux transporter MFP subunit